MSQILRECVIDEPIFSPMTSMDISAPSVKQPSPRMRSTTPTMKRTNVPEFRGVNVMESTMMMSAMGRMEVSDSMILSLSACVMCGPPFFGMGVTYCTFVRSP